MRPPRLHLKTAPTALKKLGRVDTRTFSTESVHERTSLRKEKQSPEPKVAGSSPEHGSAIQDLYRTCRKTFKLDCGLFASGRKKANSKSISDSRIAGKAAKFTNQNRGLLATGGRP
jgi:hypothetical protein